MQQHALFDFAEADRRAKKAAIAKATEHLPGDMEAAVAFHRTQIDDFNAAMLRQDQSAMDLICREAYALAEKLTGHSAIFGSDNSPVFTLIRRCAAPNGTVLLWGQEGEFTLPVAGTLVRFEWGGMLCLCGSHSGFNAHVVDYDRPFISDTGFRSFVSGGGVGHVAGMTVAQYATAAIEHHVQTEMKGKLVPINRNFRPGGRGLLGLSEDQHAEWLKKNGRR